MTVVDFRSVRIAIHAMALMWFLNGTVAHAQIVAATLPFISEEAKARIGERYVASQKLNKALALTEAGGWGFVVGSKTVEGARSGALSQCQRRNPRHACFIAAENDQLVLQSNYTPQSLYDGSIELLKRASFSREFYSHEDRDEGVSSITFHRTKDFHAPTPKNVPGVKTITTRELVELLKTSKPVLINMLNWQEGSFAIPGTVWIQGMGTAQQYSSTFSELRSILGQLVPDKNAPLVLYCLSWECWLSYNASLSASELGYKNIYWYRGGIDAWNQAGLPVVRTKLFRQL